MRRNAGQASIAKTRRAVRLRGRVRFAALVVLSGALWFGGAMIAGGAAQAVPAAPTVVELTQPDGATFHAHLYGDEWNNGYETRSGYTIVRDPRTGSWEYAAKGPKGNLHPSGRRVGTESPAGLHKHLRPDTTQAAPEVPPLSSPNTGTQRSLVILVEFNDQLHTSTPAGWSSSFFSSQLCSAGTLQASIDSFTDATLENWPGGQVTLGSAPCTVTVGRPSGNISVDGDSWRIVSFTGYTGATISANLPICRSPSAVASVTHNRPICSNSSIVGATGHSSATATITTSTKSVSSYFKEVSYNQLAIAPATESSGTANDGVVGWLALNQNHPNTGANTGTANQALARDAIVAANPFVNFASFDANNNGFISTNELHVTVIPAGCEEAFGAKPAGCKSVWGHQWTISAVTPPTVDGVVLGSSSGGGGYTQFGEMHNTHQATIGIMVHELGHDLNLPDLYDTNGGSEGVGNWSIMAGGSWLATAGQELGATPSHPDPFSKSYEGWLTPQRVTGSLAGVSIPQAETNATAKQLLDNPGGVNWTFNQSSGTGEYFLVENRQKVGYDAALPGCGILIWHIDETRTSSNSANADENRKLVDVEEADGLAQMDAQVNRGDAGDPYPGSSNNHTFNDGSNPNSKLYSGAASGVSVTNVSSGCTGTMTADLSAPVDVPPNDNFANATVLSGSTATRSGDTNVNATGEVGEPSFLSGDRNVWYSWTAPATGPVRIDTDASGFDTLLGAYTGSSVSGLTTVAEDDDSGAGLNSLVAFMAQSGVTYKIAVDGFNGANGTVNLHLNQTPCTVTGSGAGEPLTGTTGDDVICGLGGNDTLRGLGGNDTLLGGDGNDTLVPGAGNDPRVDGEAGTDRVSYTDLTSSVTVDLTALTTGGAAGTDTLVSIESAIGTRTGDILSGSAAANSLYGKGGADTLQGLAGADTLYPGTGADQVDGGANPDTVSYADVGTGAVTVDLSNNTTGGAAGVDSLVSIERATGSNAGDTITGTDLANRLKGLAGDDTIAGLGGTDTLDGGIGTDSLNGGNGTDTCTNGEVNTSCEL